MLTRAFRCTLSLAVVHALPCARDLGNCYHLGTFGGGCFLLTHIPSLRLQVRAKVHDVGIYGVLLEEGLEVGSVLDIGLSQQDDLVVLDFDDVAGVHGDPGAEPFMTVVEVDDHVLRVIPLVQAAAQQQILGELFLGPCG